MIINILQDIKSNKVLFSFSVVAKENILDIKDRIIMSSEIMPRAFYNEAGEVIKGVKLYLQLDGQDRTQQIIDFSNTDNLSIRVSPNPIQDHLTMIINSKKEEDAIITFYNIAGKQVLSLTSNLVQGENTLFFPQFSNFYSGVYTYTVSTSEKSAGGKVIKN